jgi:tetratricopeptide (TPR) repeat protein
MSASIPIITTTLGARPELAAKITWGLDNGVYERIGGVIRHAENKQIITWLRNIDGMSIDPSIVTKLGPLTLLSVATSFLNLSITAIGFAIILRRLGEIKQQLALIGSSLAGINRKIDLSFYANFGAALELARTAFEMREESNRRITATQAINRFLEAEHHYLSLLDMEFDTDSWAASQFIDTLILAYVSTARCYLELGEVETARHHLEEGSRILFPRVRHYYEAVVGIKSAIYLHPQLSSEISLKRVTQLLRYQDPALSEASVFEKLRLSIWEIASQNPETWLKELPRSLWTPEVDGKKKIGPVKISIGKDEALARLLPRLPKAFEQVERAYETSRCMEGFQVELEYLIDKNISFEEWQRLPMPEASLREPLVWLLPKDSELIEQNKGES